MIIKYGDLIRELRLENNWTIQELAERTNYSKQHISRIEKNQVVATFESSVQFTELFGFDFTVFDNNTTVFESYKDYIAYYKLADAIEKDDKPRIASTMEKYKVRETFTYGKLISLKNYAEVVVLMQKSSEKAIEFCLELLDIDEEDLKELKFSNIFVEYEVGLYLTMAVSYYNAKKLKQSMYITNALYDYINTIPTAFLHYISKKFYILIINNLSNINYEMGNYDTALKYCEEAIAKARKFNILIPLSFIYKLKMEVHYHLEQFDLAKKCYNYTQCFCETIDRVDYFEDIKKIVEEKYPEILK